MIAMCCKDWRSEVTADKEAQQQWSWRPLFELIPHDKRNFTRQKKFHTMQEIPHDTRHLLLSSALLLLPLFNSHIIHGLKKVQDDMHVVHTGETIQLWLSIIWIIPKSTDGNCCIKDSDNWNREHGGPRQKRWTPIFWSNNRQTALNALQVPCSWCQAVPGSVR